MNLIDIRLAIRRVRHRIKGLEPSPVRPMTPEERTAAEDFIKREEAEEAGTSPPHGQAE